MQTDLSGRVLPLLKAFFFNASIFFLFLRCFFFATAVVHFVYVFVIKVTTIKLDKCFFFPGLV